MEHQRGASVLRFVLVAAVAAAAGFGGGVVWASSAPSPPPDHRLPRSAAEPSSSVGVAVPTENRRRSEVRTVEPPDAGVAWTPSDRTSVRECFDQIFDDPEIVISIVDRLHTSAELQCAINQAPTGTRPALPSDPRAPCGAYSEELWSQSNDLLRPMFIAMLDAGGFSPDSMSVFRGVDCSAMADREFAAAAHFTSFAPGAVDPGFIGCAIERESRNESFPLWALLDAVRVNPAARDALGHLANRDFDDQRTKRRIDLLFRTDPEDHHRR
jgi:hypothetical protein